jgi:hypothetical protein
MSNVKRQMGEPMDYQGASRVKRRDNRAQQAQQAPPAPQAHAGPLPTLQNGMRVRRARVSGECAGWLTTTRRGHARIGVGELYVEGERVPLGDGKFTRERYCLGCLAVLVRRAGLDPS